MEGIDGEDFNSNAAGSAAEIQTAKAAVIDKGNKKQMNGKEGEKEVRLTTSHASIMEGLKARTEPISDATRSELLASQRLKIKALKDVTNPLEAQPVKLKPNWFGPKGNGASVREVGLATTWVK